MIKNIIFDFGDTLIYQKIDDQLTLNKMRLELHEGAIVTLNSLYNKGFQMGLLSNTESTNSELLREALLELKINHFFKTVVTSIDVGYKKPHYVMFETILKYMGGYPANSIMIGNNIDSDILGAKKLGMKTIFYSNVKRDIDKLKASTIQPDYIISNLTDIISLSEKWL